MVSVLSKPSPVSTPLSGDDADVWTGGLDFPEGSNNLGRLDDFSMKFRLSTTVAYTSSNSETFIT